MEDVKGGGKKAKKEKKEKKPKKEKKAEKPKKEKKEKEKKPSKEVGSKKILFLSKCEFMMGWSYPFFSCARFSRSNMVTFVRPH